jgi:acyl carrier protein
LDIIDDVRLIISKSLKIPVEQLTADARLDELGAESLDVIEIIFNLEEKFNISIPLEANEGTNAAKPSASGGNAEMQFSTIGDIADVVKKLVEAKPSR